MLFTKELKLTLNTQSDYIRAKLFLQREVFYIFFCRVLSYCYLAFFFSFYNLPFVTLSPYFIVFHILTCDFTSYLQSFSFFFILENDLSEIETSKNFIASFYLMRFEENTYSFI